jgi:ADP-ribose pyrophosphatase
MFFRMKSIWKKWWILFMKK